MSDDTLFPEIANDTNVCLDRVKNDVIALEKLYAIILLFRPHTPAYVHNVMNVRKEHAEDVAKEREFVAQDIDKSLLILRDMVGTLLENARRRRGRSTREQNNDVDKNKTVFAFGDVRNVLIATCTLPFPAQVGQDEVKIGVRQISVRAVRRLTECFASKYIRSYELTYSVLDNITESYLLRSFTVRGTVHGSD